MDQMKWPSLLSTKRIGEKSHSNEHSSLRTRFEQDYDRIIFSHPFRTLQDKTQVFPLPDDDFVHTRLTHSLEVSSVGRSLGRTVGEAIVKKDPKLKGHDFTAHDFGSIVAAACLAHDIGNPPFGHAGESSISGFFKNSNEGLFFKAIVSDKEWEDLINFEGNAQGFRLLNDPFYKGLRCTSATLATFTKYPRHSSAQKETSRKNQKKYGYCQSDLNHFEEVAKNTGLLPLHEGSWCRHPLAFLVEAADDICYLIIDLEDGTRLGLVPFEQTRALLAEIIGSRYDHDKLNELTDEDQKLGTLRALAIHQLVKDCSQVFLQKEKELLRGTFDQALTDHLSYSRTLEAISSLSIAKIYRSKQVLQREALGLDVIRNILKHTSHAMYYSVFDKSNRTDVHRTLFRLLPQATQQKLHQPEITVYEGLQIVLDFVSGLTDRSAIKLHKILTGQITVF